MRHIRPRFENMTKTKEEINYSLCRFVCEVRKQDGTEYPSKTTYEIITSLQKYLEMKGVYVKFLDDVVFKESKLVLDSEMKRKTTEGQNKPVKQAEVIGHDQKDVFWEKGLLGEDTPKQLLDTMIYLAGLHFVVRG